VPSARTRPRPSGRRRPSWLWARHRRNVLPHGTLDRLVQVCLGYRTSAGERELRRLIAANAGVADDQVLVTSGAVSALFLGLLFGDGDQEMVFVQPCFPPTLAALRGIDARVVTAQLRFEDGYRLDLPTLSDRLNSRTRLVMLSSPQNPSGVVFSQAEIEQLLAMMSRRSPEALLLVDRSSSGEPRASQMSVTSRRGSGLARDLVGGSDADRGQPRRMRAWMAWRGACSAPG
jgi:histidinol-phosphate/aromatic aminotransferase/cobyric acid decarboxylase-like protein